MPTGPPICRLHVVILGSSPLLMQSGLTESLAGRFEPISVTHWSFPEMADAFGFDLPAYLYFGGYPAAASLIRDRRPGSMARIHPGRRWSSRTSKETCLP